MHLLPQLLSKVSQKAKVYNNLIENINLENAAKPDQIVSVVPAGTGLLILGSDDVEVYGNIIRNNKTGGIGVMSAAAFLPAEQIDVGRIQSESISTTTRSSRMATSPINFCPNWA